MPISRRKLLSSGGALLGASLITSQLASADSVSEPYPMPEEKFYKEPTDLSSCINLNDIERVAKEKISHMAYEYIASGAADEFTMKWNRDAFDHLKLKPKALVDVSTISTKINLFGMELSYPVLIAPSAYHKIIHKEGEVATARGASAAEAVYVISSHTTTPLEEIMNATVQPAWFQLYIQDDREFTKELIQKVISHGCKALCITVDTPTTGCRDRQIRAKFKLPDNVHVPYMHDRNMVKAGKTPSAKKPLTWKEIEWVKSFTTIPVVLKGILNPLDAEKAVLTGADGIIVSNHGGRNLDTLPATVEVLPGIADRVGGRIPILLDGGIRRGTDIVKAIALGANAVLAGRPVCYGLGAGGADGVKKVMDILKHELETAMMLCGTPAIKDITADLIFDRMKK